jgi:DNA-directed RNA polymerase sigma subunit (sigma70/sigma32)
MVYVSIEDFYEKARACRKLSRAEEIQWAEKMKAGDPAAREMLVQSYLPMVAGHIKRLTPPMQTLGMAIYCHHALERAVDTFNFLQDSEPFSHHLSWALRQATTRYIVK